MEGWACWRAAEASLRGGMVNVHVDMASALLLAEAAGVPRLAAAELMMAAQDGVSAGLAKTKEGSA